MKYTVYVDDNFHYMDESSRYKLGEFDTWDEAVKASKKIVDDYLVDALSSAHSSDELLSSYKQFGQDPFIQCDEEDKSFSSWEYVTRRCDELYKRGRFWSGLKKLFNA
ncbi:MAG: hypothetical protein JXA42_03825 [Anaerolineales bacterium]|nr:hypothetical protein [Anaerolineales bacterium]